MARPDSRPARPAASDRRETLARSVVRPARAACFWLAVALPLLHVPLFLRGLATRGEVGAFAALLVGNVLAMRLGRGYSPAGRPVSPADADERPAVSEDRSDVGDDPAAAD